MAAQGSPKPTVPDPQVQKDPAGSDLSSSDDEEPNNHEHFTLFELIKAGCQSSSVRRIRKGGVSVADKDPKNEWNYLHAAAYYGAERTAAALVKAGANVHAVNNSLETALHLAAKWPHEKVVEVLLKAGANPNALNKRGRTPAHVAAQFARRGALELIINAGGDVSLQDMDGNTPLHLAAKGTGPGPNEVVRMLLRAKCRMDVPNKPGILPLNDVQNLQSLVVFAAMESLPDLMVALVKRGGIKLDVFDASGMTPLQTAAFKGDIAVARALLQGGAKVNFQASPSWIPCPSLAAAAENPLISHTPSSSSSNVKPLGDRSPLHFAAERGAVQMMELLIAHGAKVNNTQNEGLISPLHIAVWNQQAEAVRVLLAHKADVKARVSKNGMAPLHFACNAPAAKLEIISMLLDVKADIEERCSDGLTPLMLAAQMAPADAVRLLLIRGARVQAKGRRGMTAVDCAEGRHDILVVLGQHCAARGLAEMATKATSAAQRAARQSAKNGSPVLALPTDGSSAITATAGTSSTSMSRTSSGSGTATSNGTAAVTAAAAVANGTAGGSGLIDQLKQQLSTTSAQLYAWAAAANTRVPGSGSTTNGNAIPAPGVANTSTGRPVASDAAAVAAAAGQTGAVTHSSTLQQLLGHMGLPASLADMGSSPLASSSRDSLAGSLPLVDSAGQQGGMVGSAGGAAGGSHPSMNALSEAVQMLSCITAIVTNQAEAGLQRNRRGELRGHRKRASTTSGHAGVTVEEISSVVHTPHSRNAVVAAAAVSSTSTITASSTGPSTVLNSLAVATCSCHSSNQTPGLDPCVTTRSCSVAPDKGTLQHSEHQMHIQCTEGCHFAFHLPCWKVVRDQLRKSREDLPASFTQLLGLVQCVGNACQGKISQVCMEGPVGTQIVYSSAHATNNNNNNNNTRPVESEAIKPIRPPPSPSVVPPVTTTITVTATLTPASSSPSPSPHFHQYSWIGDKPISPPPPPPPQVITMILPPPDAATDGTAPANCGLLSNTAAGGHPNGVYVDSTQMAPASVVIDQHHQVRRKRRAARECGAGAGPAGPAAALLHASGEVLQGRNPPADMSVGPVPDPALTLIRAGLEADLVNLVSNHPVSAMAAPAAAAAAAAATPKSPVPSGGILLPRPAPSTITATAGPVNTNSDVSVDTRVHLVADGSPAPWTQLEAAVESGQAGCWGANVNGVGAPGVNALIDMAALPVMDLHAEASSCTSDSGTGSGADSDGSATSPVDINAHTGTITTAAAKHATSLVTPYAIGTAGTAPVPAAAPIVVKRPTSLETDTRPFPHAEQVARGTAPGSIQATAAPSAASLDIVHDAIMSLRTRAGVDSCARDGDVTPHLMLTCSDLVLLSQTPGMVDSWVKEHVTCSGPVVNWRLLGRYGALALSFASPTSAVQAAKTLNGRPMVVSAVNASFLKEFPDDSAIAAQAQKVAMSKNKEGGNTWMTDMVECWRILQELPAMTTPNN